MHEILLKRILKAVFEGCLFYLNYQGSCTHPISTHKTCAIKYEPYFMSLLYICLKKNESLYVKI